MDEVKHNRFVKVAEKRMEVLINDFYKLGYCASRVSYDYCVRRLARSPRPAKLSSRSAEIEQWHRPD